MVRVCGLIAIGTLGVLGGELRAQTKTGVDPVSGQPLRLEPGASLKHKAAFMEAVAKQADATAAARSSDVKQHVYVTDDSPEGGPFNNDCVERAPVFDGQTFFDTSGATTDGPPHGACLFFGDDNVNQDIWFNYTATADGPVQFSLCGSGYDTKLAVYDGCGCPVSDANLLACNDDSCGLQSQVQNIVVANQCYKIRVGGFTSASGTGVLTISPPPPPPCELICPAGATPEGEPNCGIPDTFNGGCNSVPPVVSSIACEQTVCGTAEFNGATRDTDWYEINLGSAMELTWTTLAVFETQLFVLDANCPATPVGGSGVVVPACSLGSIVRCVNPGTYRLFVAPTFTAAVGCPADYQATLTCIPCEPPPVPENDNCADRDPIFDGDTLFDTSTATTDGPAACAPMTNDIWYNYQASCDGLATVSLCGGTSFDSVLAVYDGCDCPADPANQIACDDDFCFFIGPSQAAFPVTAGNCYKIRVGGFSGATGFGNINISCSPIPQNPNCPNAGSCFAAHGNPGCDDNDCCNLVCAIDPFCCDVSWDAVCAGEAIANCELPPPPANDNCADRTPICDGATPFDGSFATTDGLGNGPACVFFGNDVINNDIWYNYTASCDGTVTINTCGSTVDTELAVYDGCDTLNCPPGQPPIACNDDFCGLQSQVTFEAVAGNCYKLRVGTFSAAVFPVGTLNISCGGGGGPDNDNCADRTDVTDGSTPFTTAGATTDGLPTGPFCVFFGNDVINNDRWYNYTATCDAFVTVDTCGSVGDTELAVYEGCDTANCPPLQAPLACNDDFCGLLSSVSFFATQGSCYKIRVGTFSAAGTASGNINITGCGGGPGVADNCFDRIDVGNGQTMFSTVGATTDGPPHVACEDGFADQQVNQDIWYNYTADVDGPVTVSLCGSGYDSKLAVYDGCDCGNLTDATLLACDDDGCGAIGGPSTLTFQAVASACYKIRVGGFGAATGSGTMTISGPAIPVSIVSANPPDNHLDPLQNVTANAAQTPQGIGGAGTPSAGAVQYSPIHVVFSGPISPPPTACNVTVTCTDAFPPAGGCPSVLSVTAAGPNAYDLVLSGPIPTRECTTITFPGTVAGEALDYRSLPGDSSLNGTTNTIDLLATVQALNNGTANLPQNPSRYDDNRSGVANTQDLLRKVQLLNGALTTEPWNQKTVAACP